MNSKRILLEGKHRWLRPDEICEVLQNPDGVQIYEKPEFKPSSGSIFLFDKNVQKHFRKDGYKWKKAKDGRTKEGHEKLKVEGVDTLNCYYAHGEEDQSFQRRIYWMLEENLSHRVLVHYRDVKGEKRMARCIEETETAEVVQHSHKTDEITPYFEMDSFASSSINSSNLQHSKATDGTNLNGAPTSEFKNTESVWDYCPSYNNPVTTGFPGTCNAILCLIQHVMTVIAQAYLITLSLLDSLDRIYCNEVTDETLALMKRVVQECEY